MSKYFSSGSLSGNSSGGILFVYNETPVGVNDGVNDIFTLAFTPAPPESLMLYKDGLLQRQGLGNDYMITGSIITFDPGNIPQTYSILLATYQK